MAKTELRYTSSKQKEANKVTETCKTVLLSKRELTYFLLFIVSHDGVTRRRNGSAVKDATK